MKLIKRSLKFGLFIEGILLLVPFLGFVLGKAGHGCVPDVWFLYAVMAAFIGGVLVSYVVSSQICFWSATFIFWPLLIYIYLLSYGFIFGREEPVA